MTNICIITCNRPDLLSRCLDSVLASSDPTDRVFVFDDSSPNNFKHNKNIVNESSCSRVQIINLFDLKSKIWNKLPLEARFLIDTSISKDIGWIRNLALVLPNSMNRLVMIDDDICDFNLNHIKDQAKKNKSTGNTIISGVHLYGVDSRDSICRLETSLTYPMTPEISFSDVVQFLQIEQPHLVNQLATTRISGGILFVDGNLKSLKPFPRSYNESWIWCRINQLISKTLCIKLGVPANHQPISLEPVSLDELVIQQTGVLAERILQYVLDLDAVEMLLSGKPQNIDLIFQEKNPITRLQILYNQHLMNEADRGARLWRLLCNQSLEICLDTFKNIDWKERFEIWLKDYFHCNKQWPRFVEVSEDILGGELR